MKRGCLLALTFAGATILAWLAMAFYFIASETRGPADSGGSAMGAGMFLISWGVAISVVTGALAAVLMWARGLPKN